MKHSLLWPFERLYLSLQLSRQDKLNAKIENARILLREPDPGYRRSGARRALAFGSASIALDDEICNMLKNHRNEHPDTLKTGLEAIQSQGAAGVITLPAVSPLCHYNAQATNLTSFVVDRLAIDTTRCLGFHIIAQKNEDLDDTLLNAMTDLAKAFYIAPLGKLYAGMENAVMKHNQAAIKAYESLIVTAIEKGRDNLAEKMTDQATILAECKQTHPLPAVGYQAKQALKNIHLAAVLKINARAWPAKSYNQTYPA